MDFEYDDDVRDQDIAYFTKQIKAHPFTDDEVRDIFQLLTSGEEPIVPHDMFAFTFRDSDVRDSRITRVCKSLTNQIFRIQFLSGEQFVIRLNPHRSYETEIGIINAVAGVGVEVPRSYFSHSQGISVGGQTYFAMLQESLVGKPFAFAAHNNLITTGDKEALLRDMGERLKLVHSITTINGKEQVNTHANFFEETLELLDNERETILSEGICERADFEDVFSKLDTLRDTARIFGGQSFGLTHMDFHPRHVLLSLQSNRPSIIAINHWESATFTNTYFDFALWDFWCGEDFLVDSMMEGYGMESFSSAESKVNVEITTIAALVNELCIFAHKPEFRATQLGVWQRLRHEVEAATY